MFVGEFDRSVDGNGRLALPAEFRDELGSSCYVTPEPSGCLAVRTAEQFQSNADELMQMVKDGALSQDALRNISRHSSKISVDKQGRVTIDEAKRARAAIEPGSQVIVVGVFDRLEIWAAERFATVAAESDEASDARDWGDR